MRSRPRILCPLIICRFSWGQKSCAYHEKSAYLATNSSIRIGLFVYYFRRKFLWLKNVSSGFSVCKIREKISWFSNLKRNLPQKPRIQSCITQFLKNNIIYIIDIFIFPKSSSFPNKHIFVRAKKVCLLWEECLLWVGTVSNSSW